MTRNVHRHSGAERAKQRYYARIYTAIFSKAFDSIALETRREFQSQREMLQAYAIATQDAAKEVISSIIGEYMKEKIIRPILATHEKV